MKFVFGILISLSALSANANVCIVRWGGHGNDVEKICNGQTTYVRVKNDFRYFEALSEAMTKLTQQGYKIVTQADDGQTYTLQK